MHGNSSIKFHIVIMHCSMPEGNPGNLIGSMTMLRDGHSRNFASIIDTDERF